MVTPPANYNGSAQSIKVDPDALYHESSVVLQGLNTDVNDTLNSIYTIWENLKLGWSGESSDEAKAFADEWRQMALRLFGPSDRNAEVTPDQAILPKIAGSVGLASRNFAEVESAIIAAFNGFTTPGSPDDSVQNLENGPITETYP
jgi:hypothetical protein